MIANPIVQRKPRQDILERAKNVRNKVQLQLNAIEPNSPTINLPASSGDLKTSINSNDTKKSSPKSQEEKNLPATDRTLGDKNEDLSDKKFSSVSQNQQMFVLQNSGRHQPFLVLRYIAKGTFGKFYLVMHMLTHLVYCLKVIKKQKYVIQGLKELIREVKIQSFMNHPNILNLYHFFTDQTNIYLLLEPCLGGNLYEQIQEKPLTQKQTKKYIYDTVKAIEYMHKNDIIHRDIKPQNILIHQGTAKICDFGLSVHSLYSRRTQCGTPLYASPQLLAFGIYDNRIDIWSLGILTYQLLYGQPPFIVSNQEHLKSIVLDQVIYPKNKDVSEFAVDFMMGCLQKDSLKRPTAHRLLGHNFFMTTKARLTFL